VTKLFFYNEEEEENDALDMLFSGVDHEEEAPIESDTSAKVIVDPTESEEDRAVRMLFGETEGGHPVDTYKAPKGETPPSAWHKLMNYAGENVSLLASGSMTGTGELLELPDTLYNSVLDAVNYVVPDLIPEEWQAHTFEATGDWMREGGDYAMREYGPTGQMDIVNKVFYGLGYTLPDLMGVAVGGGAAVKMLAKWKKVPQMLAHMVGTAGYGVATGGVEKGANFTMMEMINAPFRKYSKVIQSLAGAGVFGGYEKMMQNPRSTGYNAEEADTDAIASAIMGGLFPLISPSMGRKFTEDLSAPLKMTRAWVKKQKALALEADLGVYTNDLLGMNINHLHGKAYYEGENLNAIRELQLYTQRILGKKVKAEGPELVEALSEVMRSGPGKNKIRVEDARALAESFVEGAEIANELFTFEQKGLSPDKIMATPLEGEAFELVTIEGIQHKTTPEFAIAHEQSVIKENLLRITEQARADKNKVPITQAVKNRITRVLESTVAPEIGLEMDLKKIPVKEVVEKAMTLFHNMYASSSRARFYMDNAVKGIGINKYSNDVQLDFAAYVAAISNLNIAKRKGAKFVAGDFFSPKDNAARIKTLKLKYENGGGEIDFSEFKRMADEYFHHASLPIERAYRKGVISKEDYINMRDIPYVTSKTMLELSKEIAPIQEGLFKKTIKGAGDIPYLTKSDGSMKSEDVFFLLERHIHVMENKIDKDLFYAEMNHLAKKYPEHIVSREAKYIYIETLGDGTEVEVTRADWLETQKKKQVIKETMHQEIDSELNLEVAPLSQKKLSTRNLTSTKNLFEAENKKLAHDFLHIEKKLKKTEGDIKKRDADFESFWEKKGKKKTAGVEKDASGKYFEEGNKEGNKKLGKRTSGDFKKEIDLEVMKADNVLLRDIIAEKKNKLYELRSELRGRNIKKSSEPLKVEGWKAIKYDKLGKKEHVLINEEFSTAFASTGAMPRDTNTRIGHIAVQIATGVPLVKALSVAWNPIFGFRTVPRDINYFGFADELVSGRRFVDYTFRSHARTVRNFFDIMNGGKYFTEYAASGGMTGEAALMTAIASSSVGSRAFTTKLNSWRSQAPKTRVAYDFVTGALGKLGATTEIAVRMSHQQYLMHNLGAKNMSAEAAASRVNRLLNFNRKGGAMYWIDDMYAFAGATSQALDGLVRAGAHNPKTFLAKGMQYITARAGLAVYAYTLGNAGSDRYADSGEKLYVSDMMSKVPLDVRLRNFLLPLPGLVVEDEDGKAQQGYFKIPTEANPLTTALDIIMYASLDTYYGHPLSDDYKTAWIKNLSPIDATRFQPFTVALTAIIGNYDLNNFHQIVADSQYTNPEKQQDRDTNRLAVMFGQALGVSPKGLERVTYSVGLANNLFTGFIGTAFSQPDMTANRTVAKGWYDSLGPLSRSFMYWNKADATSTVLREQIRDSFSDSALRTSNLMVVDLVQDVKLGRITKQDAREQISNQEDSWVGDKQVARTHLDNSLKGWERYQMISKTLPGYKADRLPSMDQIMLVGSSQDITFKASWYNGIIETLDADTADAFSRISKSFGFGNPRVRHYINQGMIAK